MSSAIPSSPRYSLFRIISLKLISGVLAKNGTFRKTCGRYLHTLWPILTVTGKMSIKQISSDLAHGLLLPQSLGTNGKGVFMKRSCAMLRGRRVLFLALVVSLSVIVA